MNALMLGAYSPEHRARLYPPLRITFHEKLSGFNYQKRYSIWRFRDPDSRFRVHVCWQSLGLMCPDYLLRPL